MTRYSQLYYTLNLFKTLTAEFDKIRKLLIVIKFFPLYIKEGTVSTDNLVGGRK